MKSIYQRITLLGYIVVAALVSALRWVTEPFLPTLYVLTGTRFAVVTVKSSQVTNRDATPSVINKGFIANARVRSKRGVAAVTNGDSIASTYRLFDIKSNDLVQRLFIDCQALGAGCVAQIGLYDTTANGGAVVSVSLFTNALDVSAALRAVDVTRQSGTITVANMEKRIWELLGLAADPQKDYDVVITLTAAAAATGSAALTMEVVGEN